MRRRDGGRGENRVGGGGRGGGEVALEPKVGVGAKDWVGGGGGGDGSGYISSYRPTLSPTPPSLARCGARPPPPHVATSSRLAGSARRKASIHPSGGTSQAQRSSQRRRGDIKMVLLKKNWLGVGAIAHRVVKNTNNTKQHNTTQQSKKSTTQH